MDNMLKYLKEVKLMYIDTHCHLNSEQLYENIDEIKRAAEEKGVGLFIVPSYTIESSHLALEIAHKYDNVYCAIGYHPTEIKDYQDKEYEWLDEHLKDPKVIALGEIGLDYHWDTTTKEEQILSFKRQIALAKKHHLPIIIHSREAIQDTFDILKEEEAKIVGGIMHSYSGSVEMAKEFIKLNFLISLGGPVTFLNAKDPKIVALNIDLKYLLTETDAPYLSPHPLRGKMNKPENVVLVANEIAKIKGIAVEELNEQVLLNVNRLFKMEKKDEN